MRSDYPQRVLVHLCFREGWQTRCFVNYYLNVAKEPASAMRWLHSGTFSRCGIQSLWFTPASCRAHIHAGMQQRFTQLLQHLHIPRCPHALTENRG